MQGQAALTTVTDIIKKYVWFMTSGTIFIFR